MVADVQRKYKRNYGYVYTLFLVDGDQKKASPVNGGQKAPLNPTGNASDNIIPNSSEKVNSKNSRSDDRTYTVNVNKNNGILVDKERTSKLDAAVKVGTPFKFNPITPTAKNQEENLRNDDRIAKEIEE